MIDKNKIQVILQARMTSQRLPGKVILPIAGFPLVCLAALRAANSGLNVIVATSLDHSDDPLVEQLEKFKIKFFRGHLENVFERFNSVISQLPQDSVVVRITGDNIFPDGKFIELGLTEFFKSNHSYLRSDMSRMPYGLSIEIFKKSAFEKAKAEILSAYEIEHVTPMVRKIFGDSIFSHYDYLGYGLRCTIDYPKDFKSISELFIRISDPVNISAKELVGLLKSSRSPISKVCLGTVQLGLAYGINNKIGLPNQEAANCILNLAENNGVLHLDTARSYGISESVIGEFISKQGNKFHIVTKLASNLNIQNPEVLAIAVEESVQKSLFELKVKKLDTVLFHNFSHAFEHNGQAVFSLEKLKKKGLIESIGVSIYAPEELKKCVELSWIDHIQLPFNLFDHRWEECSEILSQLSQKVVIHCRSTFLQGLMFLEKKEKWPNNLTDSYDDFRDFIERLENKFDQDIKSIALAYCLGQHWIDSLVLGVETKDQLTEILSDISRLKSLSESDFQFIKDNRPNFPSKLLDPSQWSPNANQK